MKNFLKIFTECSFCTQNVNKKEVNLENLNKIENEEYANESMRNQTKEIEGENRGMKKNNLSKKLEEEINIKKNQFKKENTNTNSNSNNNMQLQNLNESQVYNYVENEIYDAKNDSSPKKNIIKNEENKEETKIKKVRKNLMKDLF
jgi:hypothetical protein